MRGKCAKTQGAMCKDCNEGESKQVKRKAKIGDVHSERKKWWSQRMASSTVIKSEVRDKNAKSKGQSAKSKEEAVGKILVDHFVPLVQSALQRAEAKRFRKARKWSNG